MHGATFALVVNIAVAALFAMSFAVIASSNPGHRAVHGFSLSYAIGMMTPLSELLLPWSPWPAPFMVLSYFCFLGGLLMMTVALARFLRQPPPWKAVLAILLAAVIFRWLSWSQSRDTLSFQLAYQLPFALATATSAWILLRHPQRQTLEAVAGGTFAIVASHFLVKSFLALTFGSGGSASEYISSLYALISQASTGILLIAAGLMVLLLVLQSIVRESQNVSKTDPLSGLANRRGFDQRATEVLGRARDTGLPVSVAVFDIDHFKSVNDKYGHASGDDVIRNFANLLRRAASQAAVIGRMGGEEFAVLFEHTREEGARLNAEAVRVATPQMSGAELPAVTVSGGVTEILPHETLGEAMQRADEALYQAKNSGRDRICGPNDGMPSVARRRSV